jgi:hypothetical protein
MYFKLINISYSKMSIAISLSSFIFSMSACGEKTEENTSDSIDNPDTDNPDTDNPDTDNPDTDNPDTDTGTTDPIENMVSWCDVQTLFDENCLSCHSEAVGASGSLNLEHDAWSQLVNQPSSFADGRVLVTPGDPSTSFLYIKLSGELLPEDGDPMPYGSSLDQESLAIVSDWISAGAMLDCNPADFLDTDADGFRPLDGDCNDLDATSYPDAEEVCDGVDNNCDQQVDEGLLQTFYQDFDGDGYGNPLNNELKCSANSEFVDNNTDCDDTDAFSFPGAAEHDSVSDCMKDEDEDGWGDSTSTGTVLPGTDCDDSNNTSNPGDQDSDGISSCDGDCNDYDVDIFPLSIEICDEIDNDCDSLIDDDDDDVDPSTTGSLFFADSDGDGYGNPLNSTLRCSANSEFVDNDDDCNDLDSSIYPEAMEILNDGIDQDCDDEDLSGFSNLDGDDFDSSVDCDDNDASINPDAIEIYYDGIDQNCDQLSDYDADLDGQDSDQHGGTDCDDNDVSINPDAIEIYYDGIDQNCDQLSDYDADLDGQDSDQHGGTDCDDDNISIYQGAEEIPADEIDQDCNTFDLAGWNLEITGSSWYPIHSAETVFLNVVKDSDGTVVATGSHFVDETGEISFSFPEILLPEESYWLDYFGDHNFNGTCEPLPADHVWHKFIGTPTGNTSETAPHQPSTLNDEGCASF